jgi:hypothetical protein
MEHRAEAHATGRHAVSVAAVAEEVDECRALTVIGDEVRAALAAEVVDRIAAERGFDGGHARLPGSEKVIEDFPGTGATTLPAGSSATPTMSMTEWVPEKG